MLYETYPRPTIAKVPVLYIQLALVIFLLVSYVGLAFHTAYAAGMKERAERSLSELSTTISETEANYLQLTKGINLERAYALGFRENTDNTVFLNQSGKLTASLP
jgi:hypothetical protein